MITLTITILTLLYFITLLGINPFYNYTNKGNIYGKDVKPYDPKEHRTDTTDPSVTPEVFTAQVQPPKANDTGTIEWNVQYKK